MKELPDNIKILGITYQIQYFENPTEVDPEKREIIHGHIDHYDKVLRIHSGKRPIEDVWQIIWHEILHAITGQLHIDILDSEEDDIEDVIDLLAVGINSVIQENFKEDK